MKPIYITLLLMMLLTACTNSDNTRQATDEPAAVAVVFTAEPSPLIVTRVVTRIPPSATPTAAPSPIPTLNETLLPFQDSATLLIRLTLTESPLVEQIIYSASSPVNIGQDGQITGSGQFTPTVINDTCLIDIQHEDALKYQLEGQVQGDQLLADVQITPNNRRADEHYEITCYTADGRLDRVIRIEQPILWAALDAADLWNLTFDLNAYTQSQPIDLDLDTLTSGRLNGRLSGEIRLTR